MCFSHAPPSAPQRLMPSATPLRAGALCGLADVVPHGVAAAKIVSSGTSSCMYHVAAQYTLYYNVYWAILPLDGGVPGGLEGAVA